ncbi:MAG: clostripain-related cysteine peptidase [Anaerolineae bacterium]|nr:clostripain-related cysteine peptidase [Anaerolineae bacterium]
MHVRRLNSLIVALVLILASVPAGADAQAGAAWTFMVYMAGDNDLEPYALLDMAEIEAVGSTGRVNVLVQFDRAEGYDNSQGGWTETRRYYALRDSNANSIGSQLVESMGELNMGDEGTLADFLVWGITTYPAERYAVVIWDHGAGWPGVAFDEAAGDDGLTIPEIARALERVATQTGIGALDVIAFDACLMAQIEVFQALAPFGDVGVASPELVPGMGYDYASVLQALASNPDMDAQALGRVMVDTFMYFYQNVDVGNPAFSLSAVDLSAADAVVSALGALGTAVQINPSAVLSHIGDARTNALAYTSAYLDRETVDYYASVDLGDLMGRLARVTNISQVASAAEAVADAVVGMVIHEGHSTTLVGASGVSIYFPRTRVQYEVNGAEYEVAGAADARWLNFLGLYYGTVESVVVEAPQLFITSLLQDQVSIHEPTQVSLDLTGRDIAHVDFVVNYELGDGRYVTLDRDNIVTWEEVNGEMVPVNSWENGLNSVIFPWNGETPVVTDGQTETYALLVPREGLEVAVGEGRYIAADSEKWVEATLVFDIDSREVRSVYGISTASGSAPFEIKPRPGDRFQLYWKFVNDDGSVTNEPGETLTFGDAPFRYEYVPAPDGTYRMGFVAENIAGVSSYRWIDLQVRNEALDRTVRGFTDWDFGFNFLYPEGWNEPSWDSVDEVLWTTAEDADIRLTIYPLEGARSAIEAAAALQDRWSVDLTITEKRQIPIDQGVAMVVRYTYESQKGPRGGIYATFYHPALDMGFGFDLDAAPEDLEAAFAGMDVMLSNLRLFDPSRVTAVSEWTVDVNQALGYALPVRSEWLSARLDEGGWFVYTPHTGSAQTFVAMRADRSRGIDNEALAERWLSALYDLEARQGITVTDRREYYIGNESWFAIDFSYTWAANNTPMTGAFFVTTRGDVNYVYWIEAPTDEYELAYANTFSVMIDGFEFLSGAQLHPRAAHDGRPAAAGLHRRWRQLPPGARDANGDLRHR